MRSGRWFTAHTLDSEERVGLITYQSCTQTTSRALTRKVNWKRAGLWYLPSAYAACSSLRLPQQVMVNYLKMKTFGPNLSASSLGGNSPKERSHLETTAETVSGVEERPPPPTFILTTPRGQQEGEVDRGRKNPQRAVLPLHQ